MLLFKCSRILLYHHSVIEPTNLQLCPSTDYEIKERKKTKPFSTSHEGNDSGNWVQEQYTHRWISTKEQHRGIYLSFFCLFVWGFQLFFFVISRMHFKLSRPWLNAQFLKWVKILFWIRNICTEHSWEMVTVSHSPGNKYHTREGISDTLYSAIIQLNKLVTPTHALEFKIIPLFPTPHLLTLPLCSFFWTALFSANNSFKSVPLLLLSSLRESPSPEATILALSLQFGGTT